MPYHYDPNQPRVPRGHSDGGQWTDGERGPIQPAFARTVARYAVGKTIEAGLALYTWLSQHNSYDQQAIIAIRARDYRRSESDSLKVEFVGFLNQDEVDKICQRFRDTQNMTNVAAAEVKAKYPNVPPAEYGTRVHSALDHEIKRIGHPNFRSEVSILKVKRSACLTNQVRSASTYTTKRTTATWSACTTSRLAGADSVARALRRSKEM
jgi:hypothetical protein